MMISKFSQILPYILMPPELRNWINKRLILEEKLSEQQLKDLFELGKFLLLDNELKNNEKKQLTREEKQLLGSVEKILNDLLKRLKEIKDK